MDGYTTGIITLLAINCIAALGVSLFTGFTGVFTLGHAGYMAIGAYTTAILTVQYEVNFVGAIIAGGIVAMVFAYLIGIPTLKLVGDYYTIASLGLGEAIRLVIENWQSVTRGSKRLSRDRELFDYACCSDFPGSNGHRNVFPCKQQFRQGVQGLPG